mmetsp:Transcript_8837/g.26485  ORF Transcript_8837/g.26485 Transcript_8837/m.26485 type:complete len:174 (-) Transcript_8837:257-778(-)
MQRPAVVIAAAAKRVASAIPFNNACQSSLSQCSGQVRSHYSNLRNSLSNQVSSSSSSLAISFPVKQRAFGTSTGNIDGVDGSSSSGGSSLVSDAKGATPSVENGGVTGTAPDVMPPIDDEGEEEENEMEEMFVEPHPSLGHNMVEWGGPTRGGRFAEPTRFGDWERKGRCTDF